MAYFADWDLSWVLDASQRELLLRLTPGAFDDNRAGWADALATEEWLRGNVAGARKYAEEARKGYLEQLEKAPDIPWLHSSLGAMLAILGQSEKAVREGERAVELAPIEKDPDIGWNVLRYLSVIHTRLGHPEPAIDALEQALKASYRFTPGWLRVDPNFDPLRGNPRFEKLAKGRD